MISSSDFWKLKSRYSSGVGKTMSELECHFLIPITRDINISDGQPHEETAWEWLVTQLWEGFGSGTQQPGLHDGFYPDPGTGKKIPDLSRRYYVSLPNEQLPKLRALLIEACRIFVQQMIYLSVAGITEYVVPANNKQVAKHRRLPKLKKSSLLLISTNKYKINEIRTLLAIPEIGVSSLDVPDLAHLNLELLVRNKLDYAKAKLPSDTPFFLEHAALIIDGWNGLPGGLTKQFMESVGSIGICKMMKAFRHEERSAYAKSVIGFQYRNEVRLFEGSMVGIIAAKPRETATFGLFGWDNIFIPTGETLTIAELGQRRKDTLSMRRKAIDKFSEYLQTHYELV
jgi:non-canonical purine NTP pyrophosphatase (RdgB/HAM1 family)